MYKYLQHLKFNAVPSFKHNYLENFLNCLIPEEFQKPVKNPSTYFLDNCQIQSLYITKTSNVASMIFSA